MGSDMTRGCWVQKPFLHMVGGNRGQNWRHKSELHSSIISTGTLPSSTLFSLSLFLSMLFQKVWKFGKTLVYSVASSFAWSQIGLLVRGEAIGGEEVEEAESDWGEREEDLTVEKATSPSSFPLESFQPDNLRPWRIAKCLTWAYTSFLSGTSSEGVSTEVVNINQLGVLRSVERNKFGI